MSRQEAVDQYRRALKAGQKCYRDCVRAGKYPYVQVLEPLLQGAMIAGRVDLGVLEIPIGQIAGVNTAGRQTAFAPNFMPILEPTTEFGHKWMALCEAHLGETGISDPIRCFEYMGRFYVQEGNKRVSVLKSFGATTIHAYVTRVLPVYSEDPAVRVYYEFLHFYSLSGLYQVHFNRVGDYPKLQAALGFDPDHVWTPIERRAFQTAFYTFKTAYDRISQPEPPVTTAQALLVWLHVYTLGDLRVMTQQELEKSLRTIRPELLAVQAGGQVTVQTGDDPAAGAGILGQLFRPGRLNVAFVHACAPEKSPWIAAHDAAAKTLADALQDAVTVRTYLASEFVCAEDAVEQAVQGGADVVFTTTVPLIFACRKLAPRYPAVRFLNCSVDMPYPGVRTYYGRMYEAKFLLGAIAGTMAPDGRIGYIADAPIFGAPAGVNAFALGAHLTNPRARLTLRWSCCEENAAQALRADGVSIICGSELPRTGEDGEICGLCRVAPDGTAGRLALPVWNWGDFYTRLVRGILRGGWDELNAAGTGRAVSYWWGIASGAVDVSFADALPDGVRELAGLLRGALVHGELAPFHRRLVRQDGTCVNTGERWLSPEEILHMDWLCDLVDGAIPPYEALLPMAQPIVRLQGVYRDTLQPEKRGPLL